MIAVDSNILIYAHRAAVPEHDQAQRALEQAAAHLSGWGIAVPSLAEFWSVVTHPKCVGRPSRPAEARAFLRGLMEDGGAQIWYPRQGFGERLSQMACDLNLSGVRIFDLQIALVAFENGAHEIWTHDREFVAMSGLVVRDPLVEP